MADKDDLWLVGRCIWMQEPDDSWNWTWDFHGVFSGKAKAVGKCKDQQWFIAPVVIDQQHPDAPCDWPGYENPNKTPAGPLRCKRSDIGAIRHGGGDGR